MNEREPSLNKPKNPGRVAALRERWQSNDPRWVQWREQFLRLNREKTLSLEEREKISRTKKANPPTHISQEFRERVSTARGGIMPGVLPLFQRGWRAAEVARLGFERIQATRLLKRLRKKGIIKRPSEDELREALLRRRHQDLTDDQKKNDYFIRKLVDLRLVPKDLSNWEKSQAIYEKRKRKLPDDLSARLRLEFFLTAIEQAQNGEQKLLDLYYQTGRDIDPKWFESSLAEEEDFLCETVDSLLYRLPKPPGEYPKWIRGIITVIDEESIPGKTKQALFIYFVYCLSGKGVGVTARRIGISPEQVEKGLNFVYGLMENSGPRLEEMANELYK